ncbi:MAG: thioredoxin family protein [Cyanobacteria bacterium P01_E01_bin.34]
MRLCSYVRTLSPPKVLDLGVPGAKCASIGSANPVSGTETVMACQQQRPVRVLPILCSASDDVVSNGGVMSCLSFREQSDSLERLLAQTEWVAICCTAEWSGPCQYIATEFSALAKTFREVLAIELDTDCSPETVLALGVASLPTVLMYRRGQEL